MTDISIVLIPYQQIFILTHIKNQHLSKLISRGNTKMQKIIPVGDTLIQMVIPNDTDIHEGDDSAAFKGISEKEEGHEERRAIKTREIKKREKIFLKTEN